MHSRQEREREERARAHQGYSWAAVATTSAAAEMPEGRFENLWFDACVPLRSGQPMERDGAVIVVSELLREETQSAEEGFAIVIDRAGR